MAYRVLIPAHGEAEPKHAASNWMSYQDARRFAHDWQAQFPADAVRIVPGSAPVAFSYAEHGL